MKRFLSLMLSVLFLFCGCNNTVFTDQNQSGENTENNDSSSLSEEESQLPDYPNNTDTIISNGKRYSVSTSSGESYPDSFNAELTNGSTNHTVIAYTDNSLSGYATGNLSVIIDLEDSYDTIHTFRAVYFLDNTAGLSTKLNVKVEVSDNKVEWSKPYYLLGNSAVMKSLNTAEFKSNQPICARFVRFTFEGNRSWIFLNEISVIASLSGATEPSYENLVTDAYNTLGTVSADFEKGDAANPNARKNPISEAAKYTSTVTPVSAYPDRSNNLTDGVIGQMFEDGTWVGFDGNKDFKITLDLAQTYDDISYFEVSCLANDALGIFLPTALSFSAIDEKNLKSELGIVYGNSNAAQGAYKFSLSLENNISARYIEVTFHTIKSKMHFVDEISVFGTYGNGESFYPPVVIDTISTDWDDKSNQYENLILNKPHQISMAGDIPKKYYDKNTKINSALLTDGVFSGNSNIHNGKFFKFCRGDRRKIIYDLEHLSAVDKFRMSVCYVETSAVYLPKNISVIVSEDGTEWYNIGKITLSKSDIDEIWKGELKTEQKIIARYVVFAFDVSVWVGIDELEVFGTKNKQNAISPSKFDTAEKLNVFNGRIEPSEDLLGGAKDLCLLYHDTKNAYTADDLIPYLAYVDENNNPTDIMFDSFLFLYSNAEMPSGGRPHKGSVLSDWMWCLEDLFMDGENLRAMEEAAGQIKQTLGLDDNFKYKITMSLYTPHSSVTNFGDIDKDGKSENFQIYADRVKALCTYIDIIEKRFAEADFKNIELVGYYWWHEEMVSGDKAMLNEVSDYIHTKDKDFFWIPWFCAPGYDEWAEYGFDIACMQPNYVFKTEKPYTNLINAANLTAEYGMGIEIEIAEDCLYNKNFFKRYMEYLSAGVQYGYMNDTVNMYYQSFSTYKKAFESDSAMGRAVYDMTYHYIKGDIITDPEPIAEQTLEGTKNEILFGNLGFEKDALHEYQIFAQPQNGTVTINDDGSFCFFPEKDFVGTVEFSFVYSNYMNWSTPCKVVIEIK